MGRHQDLHRAAGRPGAPGHGGPGRHETLHIHKRDEETGEIVDIFENPKTLRPWHDERSQRDHYWKPTLRALGIRERRAYCTRHTFCTVGLMGNVKPAYIAAQAGHSLKMLLEVYARWIPANDGGAERLAMAAAQGHRPEQNSQAIP